MMVECTQLSSFSLDILHFELLLRVGTLFEIASQRVFNLCLLLFPIQSKMADVQKEVEIVFEERGHSTICTCFFFSDTIQDGRRSEAAPELEVSA